MSILKKIENLHSFLLKSRRTGQTTLLREIAAANDVYVMCANEQDAREFGKGALSQNAILDGLWPKPVFFDGHAVFNLLEECFGEIEGLTSERDIAIQSIKRMGERIKERDIRMLSLSNKVRELESANAWIQAKDQLPESRSIVYVTCLSGPHAPVPSYYQTMAQYIPPLTVKSEDFLGDDEGSIAVYDEETDQFYAPEGWYEYTTEADEYWMLRNEVVFWKHRHELPRLKLTVDQILYYGWLKGFPELSEDMKDEIKAWGETNKGIDFFTMDYLPEKWCRINWMDCTRSDMDQIKKEEG